MRFKANNCCWPPNIMEINRALPLKLCFMGTQSVHSPTHIPFIRFFLYLEKYIHTHTHFVYLTTAILVYIMEIRTMQNSYKRRTRIRWVTKVIESSTSCRREKKNCLTLSILFALFFRLPKHIAMHKTEWHIGKM